jgi:phosphopantothenoylcysteine decarboxylase/phosphopantothenate--cysteine ligase
MRDAVMSALAEASIVIKAAAVADFRPARREVLKIKKEALGEGKGFSVEFVPNPDILAEVARESGDRVVVGFAAESHDVIPSAQRKLARKGCDLMVANDVSRVDAGFDVDTNAVSFVWPGGDVEELPLTSKEQVARELLDRVEKLRGERS